MKYYLVGESKDFRKRYASEKNKETVENLYWNKALVRRWEIGSELEKNKPIVYCQKVA